ncbi:expressed unknown protein [Seminavis robusta]|uniref:Uncharacterized protein n=1 Tax=Seminavis robusta TaxID=568900 RepID=A0A9N8EXY2_9STRA|nr:expressed unknown protein [Seminavis robusta]|eukprot:Sro2021_g311440.1 n/a (418) ;mRNA; r:8956-10209
MSLSSSACWSATARRRDSINSCHTTKTVESRKRRSCSPLRPLLWGSSSKSSSGEPPSPTNKSTSSSKSTISAKKSLGSSITGLFNGSGSSSLRRNDDVEPLDPTEAASLGDSDRSLLLNGGAAAATADKGPMAKPNPGAQVIPLESAPQTQEATPKQTQQAPNQAASVVPFPPEPARKQQKRRTKPRTPQEWEELVATHQRMTTKRHVKKKKKKEPLTGAVLQRRVLERKQLNAKILRNKVRFLEEPEETKVQPKTAHVVMPKRKSLPSRPKPSFDKTGIRRHCSADICSSSAVVNPQRRRGGRRPQQSPPKTTVEPTKNVGSPPASPTKAAASKQKVAPYTASSSPAAPLRRSHTSDGVYHPPSSPAASVGSIYRRRRPPPQDSLDSSVRSRVSRRPSFPSNGGRFVAQSLATPAL